MVDIAMCKGDGCSKKETCYRYLAKPDEFRQTYIGVEDVDGCYMYWECVSKGQKRRLDIMNEW